MLQRLINKTFANFDDIYENSSTIEVYRTKYITNLKT